MNDKVASMNQCNFQMGDRDECGWHTNAAIMLNDDYDTLLPCLRLRRSHVQKAIVPDQVL